MSQKDILNSILNQDLSNVTIRDFNSSPSLIDDYPKKEVILELTDLRIMQIILARRALVEKAGYLGDQIKFGKFLFEGINKSSWIVYKLNDGTDRIGVLWSHLDDDSWSIFFKGDDLDIDYLYYEN
ncbi:MAG: hypothetical protein BM557_02050 [Flavobacterium sp. MedPE-SWcel]|uniref:hypothetical protein n=1 Tax=uncultured Flavobacterium sp. TaxID=165435 RepID=UPI00091392FF|nr:hypothetical protein [uncultured Flavobacterium sp.]OIQ22180.1 MAG: hypothetical protein BM557_02050 [Flavobacterium sp. MedPE-SWcel]